MPQAGPRKVQRYSLEFKLKAVKLSQLKDVEVAGGRRCARDSSIHALALAQAGPRWCLTRNCAAACDGDENAAGSAR